MASAVARAYNGGLGRAPSGVQGQSPWSGGQGVKGAKPPPEAEAIWVLDVHKFAPFSKLWKHKDIRHLCYLCKKIMGGHETGGSEQNWGPVPPGPCLKPPLISSQSPSRLTTVCSLEDKREALLELPLLL